MKDKIPNDRLEEFLRKSLGDHSEEPPGDLWSKIAENLEPPVEVQPRLAPVRGWWAMAAAAAVLLGLLVATFLASGVPLIIGADVTLERRQG